MFDFAWSELGLIAVVAMILIGPKDMPVAIRSVTSWIRKARRMASEFQSHVDEMVRDADLHDVRESINAIRNFDIRGEIEKTVDADGSLRATFAENPLASAVTSVEEIAVSEPAVMEIAPPEEVAFPCRPDAPAFVPPNLLAPLPPHDTVEAEPPPFIPPDIVRQARAD